MDGISEVFGSLLVMTQPQLLLAFVACIAYTCAQGSLLGPRGHRIAWFSAGIAAVGFAFASADWTHAIVLLAIAMAGMGGFVAIAWLTSRAIGYRRMPTAVEVEAPVQECNAPQAADARPRAPLPGDHAHSI